MSPASPPSDLPPVIKNAPAPLRADVYVFVGQDLLAKYSIEHGEYIIGRDPTCHMVVDAELVSRHHARLTFSTYELIIEDLGSSNGVFTEGVPVQIPTRVRSDQEVQIGSARLMIQLQEDSQRQLVDALWHDGLGLEPVRQMLSGPKHRIITTIARGGMGVVMQARDVRIRRTVAMKVMKTASQFSRENVLRFIDEAQLTGQLEHPNIVPVYELATDEGGETYYTMKFVKGITLDDILRGLRSANEKIVNKYPLGALLTIFQKICDGVGFAHARGVVHRDLKPENIMIGSYGEVLVMDWGLAKHIVGGHRRTEPTRIETLTDTQVIPETRGFETLHGLVVGTPPYISPEQARGELDSIDTRSDIYVLGEILYAILTLHQPIPGTTVNEIIENIISNQVTPPTYYNTPIKSTRTRVRGEVDPEDVQLLHCPGRRIPESLSAVVMKAMQHAPDDRYQTVEEMQRDLLAYQGGFATKAERASIWKQTTLWAGRHKGEVALFIAFGILLVLTAATFFMQIKSERDSAVSSASIAGETATRAREGEKRAASALAELRDKAPAFAADAQALMDDLKFQEALVQIDAALEYQPGRAAYHALRGYALQSLLRFPEAVEAFEAALRMDSRFVSADENLVLTRRIIEGIGPDGAPDPAQLQELGRAMLDQNRVDEAFGILGKLDLNSEGFQDLMFAAFDRMGLRERIDQNPDGTVSLDLSGLDLSRGLIGGGDSRRGLSGLREMSVHPISILNLDGTRISDLSAIKGWKLARLSLNNNPVLDLTPLEGMPLRSLEADGCPILDLRPLQDMRIESLQLRNTRITSLDVLRGMPLEHLDLAGCREIVDLQPLEGMPLQELNLSRSGVTTLQPLIGSPIRELDLEGCTDLTDLHPLLQMTQLEAAVIPRQIEDIEFLRKHPTLKRLSHSKLTEPAATFWKAKGQ